MSWFDASGLTSLAKTALKEAQKTIDKALDIQHDGSEQDTTLAKEKRNTDPTPTPIQEGTDFFSTWGLTASDGLPRQDDLKSVVIESPSKIVAQSLWGSFTGSFFETGMEKYEDDKDRKSHLEMIVDDSSELGAGDEPFSKSKLVVHGLSEDSEGSSSYSRLNSENEKDNLMENSKPIIENPFADYSENCGNKDDICSVIKNAFEENDLVTLGRFSDKQNSWYINRLSIISSESGKNSSESIEVLSSQSLKTTPDSEGSLGLKLPSSSVEILPDSLMTPSSIELLGFSHSGGSHASDDEFVSPLTSPIDNESPADNKLSSKTTTDEDIKILTEINSGNNNDDDEVSAAEDTISYNSISEFTAPTILDSSNIVKSKDVRKSGSQFSNEMSDSQSKDSLSLISRISEELPITRAPSRNITHFTNHPSLLQNVQLREIPEKQSTVVNDSIIIQPSLQSQNSQSSLSLATESYSSSNEGSWSDRTLNADSEGATMESSTDDTLVNNPNSMERTASSYYVKGMLEDAINDKLNDKASESSSYCRVGEGNDVINPSWKDGTFSSSSQSYEEVDKASSVDQLEHVTLSNIEFATREQSSPVSSESRSGDMVKIGSEQTSGHTSGDDLETTTSSDIEIIPSPNGDYGSVYSLSRQSPGKLPVKFSKQSTSVVDLVLGKTIASKIRGHNRELSEASSQSNTSDDSHCSETERLLKRLTEMAEVLESREAKLIEISRKNIGLAENNLELKAMIENLQGKQDVGDVSLITEEYTQRMSALEKKFQQAIREKDTLRKQMETYKQEAATRMTSGELENAIGERDETIRELREEGEKLSKQQLHHSTIIKRLRTKEKENEQVIKTLREKVAEQAQEMDRMKRSIAAKEAIECTQIESVYKLTAINKKMDSELADNKALLDDSNQKLETMKTSLDAAKKELLELQKNSGDLAKRQEALVNIEREKSTMEAENENLLQQLEELRMKIRQDEQRWMNRESSLRSEVSRQMARAEEAESALQTGAAGEGSHGGGGQDGGALLIQLAALQDSCVERDRRAQARERQLQQAAADAQGRLSKTMEAHQLLKDECQSLHSKLSTTEYNLMHATQKLDNSVLACEEHMSQLKIALDSNERLKKEYENYKKEAVHSTKQLNDRLLNVEQHLSVEKAACEAEKRRNTILQEQLRETSHSTNEHGESSLLLARLMGAGPSCAPEAPPQIFPVPDRTEAPSPHGSIGRDSLASESLASGMWLDDSDSCTMGGMGPINTCGDSGLVAMEQLQAALQRREGELRAARRATRASHAQRAALARELAAHASELDTMQSVQHQYDALLQMYGEKEEQLQELRLDLQDVKDMYKMQLDEILMLKRQASERNNK